MRQIASAGSILIEKATMTVDREPQLCAWSGVFAPHTVHELLFDPTCIEPPSFLAIFAAKHSSVDRPLVWVDPSSSFYPPAAWSCLNRLHILRPKTTDVTWAAVECLRCKQMGAVVVVMLHRPTRVEVRRLQLAAEQGGSVGILLRPNTVSQGSHVYASVSRWLVSPTPGQRAIQRWRVDHVHGHGRQFGPSFIVEKKPCNRRDSFCAFTCRTGRSRDGCGGPWRVRSSCIVSGIPGR